MVLQVSGEGHATAAFIAALSDRITSFTQHLNSIKQQQRSDYGSLLQQEQQLLEELAVLELTLLDEQQLQPAPAHADCWHSPAGLHAGSATLSTAQGRTSCSSQHGTLHMQDNGTGADAAADCVCRSPDRQQDSRSSSRSPAKQPLHGPSTTSMHTNAVVPSPGSSSSLPPEVQAYDAFIARHGATGGWHPDDHKAFMEVLKAHRCGRCSTTCTNALPWVQPTAAQSVCSWLTAAFGAQAAAAASHDRSEQQRMQMHRVDSFSKHVMGLRCQLHACCGLLTRHTALNPPAFSAYVLLC